MMMYENKFLNSSFLLQNKKKKKKTDERFVTWTKSKRFRRIILIQKTTVFVWMFGAKLLLCYRYIDRFVCRIYHSGSIFFLFVVCLFFRVPFIHPHTLLLQININDMWLYSTFSFFLFPKKSISFFFCTEFGSHNTSFGMK